MWRYIPHIAVAICIALLWGTAFAEERVHLIGNTLLCDEKSQMVDILEASQKSGQFQDSRFTFQRYAMMRNQIGEPSCALMAEPYPYLVHNEFVRVPSINPVTGSLEDFYVAKVTYESNAGLSEGYIMLSKDALNSITKEEQVGRDA